MLSFTALFRRFAPCVGALLALSGGAAGFAAPPESPTAPVTATVPDAPVGAPFAYTDSIRKSDGTLLGLQTAIRRFEPVNGIGPTVYLVAAVHIGEKAYYRKLQEFLNKQDVVLCEGIRAWPEPSPDSRKTGRKPAPGPKVKPQSNEFYTRLAATLKLSTQEAIDYRRPNFYNSDLTWAALDQLAQEKGATATRKLRELKSRHALTGPEGKELEAVLQKLASNPALARAFRDHLVELLLHPDRRAPEEKSQAERQEEKEEAEFDTIVIAARNKAVLADLKRLLTHPTKPITSIALFYGAGHMQDLDSHLESDLGYEGWGADWLTAITTVP